jgi:O-antigen ligase
MRRAVPALAAACLLAGPAVLAFRSGGYFPEPQLIAGIVAWALVIALVVAGPAPLPRTRAGIVVVAGMALLTAWTAASIAWAPVAGDARDDTVRLLLYLGALLTAIGALRHRGALRATEPALAAGATVVIAYGLAGRLLPGLIELARSRSAGGRLEQPITYWNAEGALAAVGLVLCARLAGDPSRPRWMRALAAAATVPLAAGVYLSFSRGAIAVAALGLLVLAALARSRSQLRASAAALGLGVAAALAVAFLPGVASLGGDHATRDGAIALALLACLAAAGAALALREPRGAPDDMPAWGRRLGPAAAAIAVAVVAGLVVGALNERPSGSELSAGAQPSRLASVSSNRYEYWRVALGAFADDPLKGTGAGGFAVVWLEERPIRETVRDTHSIEFELLAELGLVGLLALALAIGGTAAASRGALSAQRAAAAGPVAAALTWFLHASIDWDWQFPAVTLPAIALAGALIVLSEDAQPGAPSGSSRLRAARARRTAAGSRA